MILRQRTAKKQQGFTIVELMIATSVFSSVLLVCTYGLLEIGRAYYKGVTISRTQETARLILDDVTEAIQFSGGSVIANAEANGWHCIGTKRYSFALNRQKLDNNHVVVSDTVGGCNSSTGRNGQVDGTVLSGPTLPKELMNARIRITKFRVEQINTNLYRVTIRVISGEDNMHTTIAGERSCLGDRSSSQFCAVSELVTVARKRV